MKSLRERPKTRLAIWSFSSGVGLSILVFLIMTEFVHPHDPSESLWLRIVFTIVCSIPTPIAIWGVIMTAKELLKKT